MERKIRLGIFIIILLGIFAVTFLFFSLTNAPEEGGKSATDTRTFDPFGLLDENSQINTQTETPKDSEPGLFAQTLSLLHDRPTTAGVFADENTVRFIERETGHIFDINTETLQRSRISNTTIPRTDSVFWGEDLNNPIYQYLGDDGDTVETFVGTINISTSTEAGLDGFFLERNITSLTREPSGDELFYMTNSNGFIYNSQTKVGRSVYLFGLKSLLAQWINPSLILITTKPSYVSPGYIFTLNPNSGSLKTVLRGIPGASASASPDGNFILYSSSSGNFFSTFLFDVASGESTSFPLKTLPEKCAWSYTSNAVYCAVPNQLPKNMPDEWYQGVVSFEDSLWRINIETLETTLILSDEDFVSGPLDAINLTIDEENEKLLFINKYNSSFWMLKIQKEGN
jgi:hypothetical protein